MTAWVTSLYAFFIVEAKYRLFPIQYFWWTILGTSAIVFSIAACVIYRYAGTFLPQPEQKWERSAQRV